MLCDRCVLNGRCEFFVPGEDCRVEKRSYDRLVSELVEQYGLEGLADEILVGRVAMYLVRIARAEVYEANVGVSDKSAVWGRYIAGLDKVLRGLMKDLALTRAKRREAEKDDLFVDVNRLLKRLEKEKKRKKKGKVDKRVMLQVHSPMSLVLKDWEAEMKEAETSGKRGQGDRSEKEG